jgi:hypothetical protein
LNLDLSKPQRQHMLNLADALLVCEAEKTLAALQRQVIAAPDASNMADFLRISPWKAEDVRSAVRISQVSWAVPQAERLGLPKVLYINIDDSLSEKDKDTRHLEPVDWFHDHSESTRSKPVFKNAFCYLTANLRIGKMVVTVDLRLYLREKNRAAAQPSAPSRAAHPLSQQKQPGQKHPGRLATLAARRLGRLRAVRQLVRFRTIDQICPPPRLARHLRSQTQPQAQRRVLRQSRKLPPRSDRFRSQAQAVHPRSGDRCGREQNHLLCAPDHRSLAEGSLRCPRVLLETAPREKSPAYFMSTDLTRSAQQALQGYSGRWSCEVGNF